VTNTCPFFNNVAVCHSRGFTRLPASRHSAATQGCECKNAPKDKRNNTKNDGITELVEERIDLMQDNVFMWRLGFTQRIVAADIANKFMLL